MRLDQITGEAAKARPDINKLRIKVRKAKIHHSTAKNTTRRQRRDKKFGRV